MTVLYRDRELMETKLNRLALRLAFGGLFIAVLIQVTINIFH